MAVRARLLRQAGMLVAALLLSTAVGCSRARQSQSGTEAAPSVEDTLSNGIPLALATRSAEWARMWSKAAPGFIPDSMVRADWSVGDLGKGVRPLNQSLVAGTDSTVLREVLGEISPSGRFLLVADAYRGLPDSCEAENPEGGEPDEAAVLIDYERRTCDTFFFCGTPCTFDWGCWVDSTHFALAGSEGDEEHSAWGFIRLYSMSENLVRIWHTRPTSLSARELYYSATQDRLMAKCRSWTASRRRS